MASRTQYQQQTFGIFKEFWRRISNCSEDLSSEVIHASHVAIHETGLLCYCKFVFHLLLLSNPSDLNQIRSMRSFAFITSNTKSGRLSRPSYTKATQSNRCCRVASIMLHFVQILNFLSPRENLRVFK
ncbi:hypothetical protein AVEN_22690-1 [Araneus ventricosus]|uniref:Uncharacterized protein n=1 Tax=Araneus ventricosus TaxID=182803 RepID=A0A4Y2WFD6_ARAVE|nr:hypothetical protein AVEN_22690-1 [Araneus ventricosus]